MLMYANLMMLYVRFYLFVVTRSNIRNGNNKNTVIKSTNSSFILILPQIATNFLKSNHIFAYFLFRHALISDFYPSSISPIRFLSSLCFFFALRLFRGGDRSLCSEHNPIFM